MKPDVVVYPIVMTKDEDDYIFVKVPDLEGGYTQGNDEIDAIKMAEDLIGNLLEEETVYPRPSELTQSDVINDEKVVYVSVDLTKFRNMYTKKVRRNVTIPEYLNNMAKKQKINVSQLLTETLEKKFGL
ncbi:type II toxin-antitoxin system HicB family antitoxin [Pediococcus argentinicus]|uniref:Toxin-antitoxin system, antitoxin component, HicB family n=1 Tax=Pediococcus argentinicus TaxID=480391 RepID=A0A0R2N6Z9_9LACO|nr:type II toxin-antitoxin system HicB family antitoxin [Pediococcus argentinicus]KRO21601.1 toxin-antitoxin system, antitoxin component, HicB family [Pediococcus argentinicus]NKZ23124.1 antitoxin HicB [Pediococcus argentinicus]GEP20276.1 antitoxin HicB [Pediococcus argentinicus]